VVYLAVGTPQAILTATAPPGSPHGVTEEQVVAMVERLAARMRANPDDPQGWKVLARSYAALGRFKEASDAYANAAARVNDDAQLYADYADALAMAQGRTLEGEPEKLIARALAIDPANTKALALAGRHEPRDFVDILFVHRTVLPLAALVWAAVGKDPGFTPLSLLELLRRQGRYRPEDFARLNLAEPFDLPAAKTAWLAALDEAEAFARTRPPGESGCLYYSRSTSTFVVPVADVGLADQHIVPHFGAPGGVVPRIAGTT